MATSCTGPTAVRLPYPLPASCFLAGSCYEESFPSSLQITRPLSDLIAMLVLLNSREIVVGEQSGDSCRKRLQIFDCSVLRLPQQSSL